MTDEQYGRTWTVQNSIPPPNKVSTGKWLWYSSKDNGYPYFHSSLCCLLDQDFYPTEAAAYADLGRAIREIHREVPELKE